NYRAAIWSLSLHDALPISLLVGRWFVLQGRMTTGAVISISQLIGGVVAPLEQVPELLLQIRSTQSLRRKCKEILKTVSDHRPHRSEEHTSELQSRFDLVCR